MNKDEILAKSRNENRNGDEMVQQVKLRTASISRAVGFCLCVFGVFVDSIFLKIGLLGLVCWTVYWGMLAAEEWVIYVGLKVKYGLFKALVNTIFFIAFTVFSIIWAIELI